MKKINEKTKIYSVETDVPICLQIKKKDDSKIFEIKNLNTVGADASVRPKIKLTEIGKIIEEHLKNIDKIYEKNVILDEYIIMPDHIHFIIQIRRTEASAPTKDNSRI